MKIKLLTIFGVVALLQTSCSRLMVSDVSYVSLRNEHPNQSAAKIISVKHNIDEEGKLVVDVFNESNEIMTIDRTKSFVVIGGVSTPFYDPTIKTTTHQTSLSNTRGATVNAGMVANALGASSAVTRILSGVNVVDASTAGASMTKTEYSIDQPIVSIAPGGAIDMGRTFEVKIGGDFLRELSTANTAKQDLIQPSISPQKSPIRFSVVITYSLDDGRTWDKIVSEYYMNSIFQSYVRTRGQVNTALRNILKSSDTLFSDNWYLLFFNVYIDGADGRRSATTKSQSYLNNNLIHNR